MRIGFDAKRIFHNATGLGNYGRDLVAILQKYYTNNTYFLYNPKPKKIKRLQLTEHTIEILPKKKWKKFNSIWRQGPIVKQLKENGVEVFHGLSGEIPRGLSKNGIKSVVTIHDLIFVRYPKLYPFIDRKIYLKKAKYAVKNADKVIAISEQTKKDIVEFLKVDASKIEVIYQGCHEIFKKELTKNFKKETLDKLKLPHQFILNVGTIEERKNVFSLVKSMQHIDYPLVIVGKKTAYYNQIQKYLETNTFKNKIYFLEGLTLKELAVLYKQATIFAYPSIFEGFGIPIIEALYAKTPVITTYNGVFPEAAGPNSVFVEPFNIPMISEKINDLLDNEEKRDSIALKGFDFVQKFNDDVIAKTIVDTYKSL